MAINRFKEMIQAGVAPARYNIDFCDYENNVYHSDNQVVRLYNDIWGALTDTNMRFNKLNDSWLITGRFVATAKFDELLDLDHYCTTWFVTSFPGTNITTLRKFFEHFQLCGARTVHNGEIAFVLTDKQTCMKAMEDIIASYKFGDEAILPCGGETICSEKTLKKYTDYCLDHENEIKNYCCSVCNSCDSHEDKLIKIIKALFPFAALNADYYKTYKVVRADGIGNFTLDNCVLNGQFSNGQNCEIDFNEDDLLDNLISKFSFLKASL